eukprot:1127072-Amphidinium_carterae.3
MAAASKVLPHTALPIQKIDFVLKLLRQGATSLVVQGAAVPMGRHHTESGVGYDDSHVEFIQMLLQLLLMLLLEFIRSELPNLLNPDGSMLGIRQWVPSSFQSHQFGVQPSACAWIAMCCQRMDALTKEGSTLQQ